MVVILLDPTLVPRRAVEYCLNDAVEDTLGKARMRALLSSIGRQNHATSPPPNATSPGPGAEIRIKLQFQLNRATVHGIIPEVYAITSGGANNIHWDRAGEFSIGGASSCGAQMWLVSEVVAARLLISYTPTNNTNHIGLV